MAQTIHLPVRCYQAPTAVTFACEPSRTALLLVDCNGDQMPGCFGPVKRDCIAPVLQMARRIGIRPVYLFQSGYGTGGPMDVVRTLVEPTLRADDWQPTIPEYGPEIAPMAGEAILPKVHQDAFQGSHVDYYLRTWGIDTILVVGFYLECCVYQTCLGARLRNYRVILLRDCTSPPGASEDRRSVDPANPEGGWVRWVFLSMHEKLVGPTSTSAEFHAACAAADAKSP